MKTNWKILINGQLLLAYSYGQLDNQDMVKTTR